MTQPAVSVIVPVYNGEQYLRSAIESVLSQTFQDYELIVVDDGSIDSTPSIAQEYGSLKYVRQENTGVAGAFNHGISLAAGRYISWLSHDDMFLPEKLERQVGALRQITTPAACYTDVQTIDAEGNVVAELRLPEYGRRKALKHVLTSGPICAASYSIMYDRRCVEEVGLYSEYWRYTQDAEMLMRLARRFPLVRVPEFLIQVREHEQRGIRSAGWEREVVRFFREQLNAMSLAELFPELEEGASRRERVRAYRWLADTLAARPFPLYRAAYSQYRRVLRENPASAAALLPNVGRLGWRSFRQHVNRQTVMAKLKTRGG